MVKKPLIKKLQIKPGQRMTIINPPQKYVDILGLLPAGVESVQNLVGLTIPTARGGKIQKVNKGNLWRRGGT